jgi:hypothetical protein
LTLLEVKQLPQSAQLVLLGQVVAQQELQVLLAAQVQLASVQAERLVQQGQLLIFLDMS